MYVEPIACGWEGGGGMGVCESGGGGLSTWTSYQCPDVVFEGLKKNQSI